MQDKNRTEKIHTSVDNWVEKAYHEACEEICKPDFYMWRYLEYAFKSNISPACVFRTFAEMLKTGVQFSHDKSDLWLSNQLVELIKIHENVEMRRFMTHLFEELEEKTFESFPFLVMRAHGRLKSYRSTITKMLRRQIMFTILTDVKNDVSQIVHDESERPIALRYINKLIEINISSSLNDIFGYRFVVYATDYKTSEQALISFLYQYKEFVKDFFEEQGFEVVNEKDYIKSPKDTGYQSLHLRVIIQNLPVEVQIRTAQMHDVAENGSASHDKVYKDDWLHNYMKKEWPNLAGEKRAMFEETGILKEIELPSICWVFVPNSEIPATPQELKPFKDIKFLKEVWTTEKNS